MFSGHLRRKRTLMLTEKEALEKMWLYFKQADIVEKRQPYSIRFMSRVGLDSSVHFQKLKEIRPDAALHVESTFRDHWCIMFETPFTSPPYDIVNVDAETGEVTMPMVL